MIGSWHGLVIDCSYPGVLAEFYERLLGYTRVQDEGDWVVIGVSPDAPGLAFQQVVNYQPPQWPSHEHPTQMHLDIRVADLAAAAAAAVDLGAAVLAQASAEYWVLQDPAGHPFCLVSF